jgi:hypothetical protein
MWQLLLNGLSVAGSLASLTSFASGFSVDKNVAQIQKSLQRLEELQEEVLHDGRLGRAVLDNAIPLLSSFADLKNPNQQSLSANALEQIIGSIHREEAERTRSILRDALQEMTAVIQSFHLTQSPPIQTPVHIFQRLVRDPYEAGVTGMWDISEGGVWTRDEPLLVNPMLTPVTWANPVTGRTFLGQMPLSRLYQFGVDVQPPTYRHSTDGLVFSERCGLYVPSHLVVGV